MLTQTERGYADKSTTEFFPFRSVLFLVLLASGGYLLFHHHAFTNPNPTSPPVGANSTPCDCTVSPPPPCECNNTATEAEEEMESISSNNRRPSINLQIICPTPPPLVDRQVMLSLSFGKISTHQLSQGSTGSWGEHLFHTPPPYQTPFPGLENSSQDQPNPIHIHLCQEDH